MKSSFPTSEGYIPFRGYKTWYRVVGDREEPGRYPLLILHGGPGAPHDYLEPLEALADTGRRVIFYDQLGCGNSSLPQPAPELWTVGLYLEELDNVRRALKLDQIHLLGQSWGGMLAMEYALTRPQGLLSMVLASSPASIPQWEMELNRLRKDLPPQVQATLREHEEAGTTQDPAYEEATMEFYRRHLCRLEPWPEPLTRAFAKLTENPEVYNTMFGSNEFRPTGTLKTWDITGRLGEIRVPTLVITGRYDEATPAIAETVHRGIAGSQWVLLEHSSHMAHLEEPERYHQVVTDFLARLEEAQSKQGI